MFSYCKSLTFVNLSNFDTRNVEEMFSLFLDCDNLIGVDVSSFVTNNVIDIHLMFQGCPKLEFLNITNFELESRKINFYFNMFDDDVNLHLYIKSSLYYLIIDENYFLQKIDRNVTIVP